MSVPSRVDVVLVQRPGGSLSAYGPFRDVNEAAKMADAIATNDPTVMTDVLVVHPVTRMGGF